METTRTINCPWCGTSYSASHIFSYIVYACNICLGGYTIMSNGKVVKVVGRPPSEEIMRVGK